MTTIISPSDPRPEQESVPARLWIVQHDTRRDVAPRIGLYPAQPTVRLVDNDSITIEADLPSAWGRPGLYIQGRAVGGISPNRSVIPDGRTVWTWKGRLLHLCFGHTSFGIESEDEQQYIEFGPIDVLARAERADNVRQWLDFLARQDGRVLAAAFAHGSLSPDPGSWAPSTERLLEASESVLRVAEAMLFARSRRLRTRLREETALRTPRPSDIIDDRTAWHILHQLDQAQRQPSGHDLAVKVRGRPLYFRQLVAARKTESLDTYENRILAGLLLNTERRLLELQAHMVSQMSRAALEPAVLPRGSHRSGYRHFATLCRTHIRTVLDRPYGLVTTLITRVRRCRRRVSELMPDVRPLPRPPRSTPVFSTDPGYQRLFQAARQWYQLGAGLADATELLLGLKTVDKLFEFVCLFNLINVLQQNGWSPSAGATSGRTADGRAQSVNTYFRFEHTRLGQLELLYEPSIAPFGVGEPLWDLVKVARSRKPEHHLQPDFLLRWTNRQGRVVVRAALDAKMTSKTNVTFTELPDLTLKYMHGVRDWRHPGRLPFDLLWLMFPDENPHGYHPYHWGGHGDLPGRRPLWPSLGTVAIRPTSHQDGLQRWYSQALLAIASTEGRQA